MYRFYFLYTNKRMDEQYFNVMHYVMHYITHACLDDENKEIEN